MNYFSLASSNHFKQEYEGIKTHAVKLWDIDKLKSNDNNKSGWLLTYLKCDTIEKLTREVFYPNHGRNVELTLQIALHVKKLIFVALVN